MTRNLEKLLSMVAMAGLLGATGCVGGAKTTPAANPSEVDSTTNGQGGTSAANPTDSSNPANAQNTSSGSTSNTFDHTDDDTVDPFQVLAREQEEGPPEVSTRMHSCGKVKYATMGRILSDFGVDLTQTGATTPGFLYTSGSGALGKPDYSNRISEAATLSTSGAVRLYDIFVAAAPAIVSGMPMVQRCMVAGAATSMFDSMGACTAAGIQCLTGAPAVQAQIDLCTSAVQSNTMDMVGPTGSQLTVGQVVAVASLLSAAHTCE